MNKILLLLLIFPAFCSGQSIENLDIKNGFLQFKLGDSISNYKEVINNPSKASPQRYTVKLKAVKKLSRYLETLTLVAKNGLIDDIEVYIKGADNISYINDTMQKVYGNAVDITNDTGIEPGIHNSVKMWEGKRVTAAIKTIRSDIETNGMRVEIIFGTLIFQKTSDVKITGELNSDFSL